MPRDNSCSRVPPTFHKCASPVNPRGAPQCTQPQSQGYTDAPSRSRRERPPHPPSALLPRPTERAAPGSAGRGPRHPATCPSDAQNHGQPTVTGALGAERPRVARSSPTRQHATTIPGFPHGSPAGRPVGRPIGPPGPDSSRPRATKPLRLSTSSTGCRPWPWWSSRGPITRVYARRSPGSWPPPAMTRSGVTGLSGPPSECPLRSPPGGGPRGPSDASPDAITH